MVTRGRATIGRLYIWAGGTMLAVGWAHRNLNGGTPNAMRRTGPGQELTDKEDSKTMRNTGLIAAGALAATMLAGCNGFELRNAQSLAAPGETFDRSLFAGYISLATSEYEEGDYRDSDKFAVRAAKVSDGRIVAPEEIAMRALPKDKLGAMTDARKRLVAALVSGAREKAPATAANAQIRFDCWMQEQEENFQPDHIAYCRDGFLSAMARIEAAMTPPPKPVAAKPAPKPAKQVFVVYFPFDSDQITPAAKRLILDAIDAAKTMGPTRIAVFGHTDTAGPRRYNAVLAEARMRVVAKELANAGFAEGRMNLGSFGEMLPAVATGDGVRSQKNRRAVIEISR